MTDISYGDDMRKYDSYDKYECKCGGTGAGNDPTLTDNLKAPKTQKCPYCDGFGVIYVLVGFEPPSYAGQKLVD